MNVPYSWLKDFVDIDISIEELSDKLVSCGFEVEAINYMRDSIKNVVVGKVLEQTKHTNSDNLSICQIDVGEKTVQIVTAAKNVKVGDYVPVALDGSVLLSGKKINKGELRGVESFGMMCSGEELGLIEEDFEGAGVYGIWIIKEDVKPGMDINDVIGNNEVVLDVGITANRPDCNSILGVAREVAAVCKKPLKMPDFSYKTVKNDDVNNYVKITNKAFDLCPRYMASAVVDVKQEVSPKLIRDRLKSVGIRPINNLVDVTNYILIEIGQPMHAFDQKLLENNEIIIRRAENKEKIVALDSKEYELSKEDLVICDAKKPVAVAGIMGGEYSSICDTTNTVVLESARFARDSIRHTSRNLNLKSDSSARFEKGIDYVSQEMGMNRALALFDKYNWGKIVEGKIDIIDKKYSERTFEFNYKDVNRIIGADIPKKTIMDILNSLTLKTTDKGDILTTLIPDYREDIVAVNDIAEEIIRMYGYDVVKPRMKYSTKGKKTIHQLRYDKIHQFMVGKGAFEILTYSFIPKKGMDMLNVESDSDLRNQIEIANPLSVDFSVMRTTLSYSMIKTIANNCARGNKNGRLYEIAKTFVPKSLPLTELPIEENKLSIGLFGENEDYYQLKSIVDDLAVMTGIELDYERENVSFLHPGRSAKILANGKKVGVLGEVHPDCLENFGINQRIYVAELDIEYFVNNGIDIKPYKEVSKYQAMERDLALVTPNDMPVAKLLKTIKNSCSEILESANVFDVYEGGKLGAMNKKSVAIKLIFRDLNRTLVDADVSCEIEKVLSELKKIDVCLR